ncbi:MAG: histone deacetylase [bacterium]
MSRTGILHHDDFLKHKTGSGHPERPDRLENLIDYLKKSEIYTDLIHIVAQPGKLSWIEQIHPQSYIEHINNACQPGLHYLDPDTVVCGDSFQVALLAVGGAIESCKAVMQREIDNAFCAVRPPGHHAEPIKAMGFCLFNNVAIAAKYLQNHYPIQKVCIIDWDVHHGNGTQKAFYEDASVFYISIHQYPFYPGTGRAEEKGRGEGEGTTLNFPSPPGTGDQEYLGIFERHIIPAVRNFNPDFLLISAGFDAHRLDPLANMAVTEYGFGRMTELVKSLAEECCQGRLVSFLEGGYSLEALARSVETHLQKMRN